MRRVCRRWAHRRGGRAKERQRAGCGGPSAGRRPVAHASGARGRERADPRGPAATGVTPNPVLEAARRGDVAAVTAALQGLPEAERRRLAPEAMRLLRAVREAYI